MRPIKFKAWDKKEKKICAVTRLEFTIGGDVTQGQFGWYGTGWEDIEGVLLKNRRYILMQYTGLKDCDGKEIYEGDILNHNTQRNYLVVFDDGCFRIGSNMTELTQGLINHYGYKVIGDVYNNPELLEKGDNYGSKNCH